MLSSTRAILKFLGFLWITARALTNFAFKVRHNPTARIRADWCNRWARAYLRLLNVEVTTQGSPPSSGLLTCNHLSYLDIVVLGGVRPQVFLSKAEVRDWPIIGWLTRCAGTLFVRRDRKADVSDLQTSLREVVEQGIPLTLFPEGTSTDGSSVLPFRSSFLEPAAQSNWTVTPAWIGYRLEEGSVADEICYWGDMTFASHFIRLLSKKKIYATVVYGEAVAPGLDRKRMAMALHREVSALAASGRNSGAPLTPPENLEPIFGK